MEGSSRDPPDNNRGNRMPPVTPVTRAEQRAAQRAAIASSLQAHTHHPEGVVARHSAPTENNGPTNGTGTGGPSGASQPSPAPAERPNLTSTTAQAPASDGGNAAQGDAPVSRLARLRASVANRFPTITRRRPSVLILANEASNSDSSLGSTVASARNSPINGTSPANGARRTTITAGPANASDGATPLQRLALTSRFAASLAAASRNPSRRPPIITASGSPSLILRVSTDDGGPAPGFNPNGTRASPRARSASAAGATPSVGRDLSADANPTVVGDFSASASAFRPGVTTSRAGSDAFRSSGATAPRRRATANGSPAARASGAQAFRNGPAAHDTIPAGGILPAAGGAPAVGTMPSIGRTAYITIQAPDNEFYTVRIDLTDAAPNATYNITINIPPP